jgi:hypothetical protein
LENISQPIEDLIQCALNGDLVKTNEQIEIFTSYVNKLIDASLMACSISNDTHGIQMVQMTISNLKTLLPEIIYASK